MSALEFVSAGPAHEDRGHVRLRPARLCAELCLVRHSSTPWCTFSSHSLISSLDELVKDGQNGRTFENATQLADLLEVRVSHGEWHVPHLAHSVAAHILP